MKAKYHLATISLGKDEGPTPMRFDMEMDVLAHATPGPDGKREMVMCTHPRAVQRPDMPAILSLFEDALWAIQMDGADTSVYKPAA